MLRLSGPQQEAYTRLAKRFTTDRELVKLDALTQLRFAANHHLLLRINYTEDILKQMTKTLMQV